jgi:hypothetical protein
MRTTDDKVLTRLLVLLAASIMLASACSDSAQQHTSFTAASYVAPAELAASSEYLLKVIVDRDGISEESPVSEHDVFSLFTRGATVTEVIAVRPDAPRLLKVGSKLKVGQVLLGSQKKDFVIDEDTPFPDGTSAVAAGSSYLIFAVSREGDGRDPYLEIVGYVSDGGKGVFGGLPGPLNGSRADSAELAALAKVDLASPAPWRQVEESDPAITVDTSANRAPETVTS